MTIAAPPIRRAPLGPQTQPRMSRHDIICVHTMVGYLTSTDPFFRVSNGAGYAGTESHYGIGGRWGPDLGGGFDGRIWQWQDLQHTADANYQGNPRVISVETADNAPARPEDIQPWTDQQLAAIIALLSWLCTPAAHAGCPTAWTCHQEGIPPVLVPDTRSDRRGLAYHAQGAAEHTAGEWWSTTHDKPCPARARITQFRTVVVPAVAAAVRSGSITQEDDVSAEDVWDLRLPIPADLVDHYAKDSPGYRADRLLYGNNALLNDLNDTVRAQGAMIAAQSAALTKLVGLLADGNTVQPDELEEILRRVLAEALPPVLPASGPAA